MLAEQPPIDMAALLGMFHHVSPVLRRRLTELLDTIREAAKEDQSSESLLAVPVEVVPEAMDVDGVVGATDIPQTQDHICKTGKLFTLATVNHVLTLKP